MAQESEAVRGQLTMYAARKCMIAARKSSIPATPESIEETIERFESGKFPEMYQDMYVGTVHHDFTGESRAIL